MRVPLELLQVSKERVGSEVEGMLKSQDPVEAMRHLLRYATSFHQQYWLPT